MSDRETLVQRYACVPMSRRTFGKIAGGAAITAATQRMARATGVNLITQSPGYHLTTVSSSFTETYSSSTAGASLLLFTIASSTNVDPSTATITDKVGGVSTNNTWHHTTARIANSLNGLVIWYSWASASDASPLVTGASHVITCAITTNACTGWAYAFDGTVVSSDPLGALAIRQNGAAQQGVSSLATNNVTPTAAGDLMFTALSERSIAGTYTSSPITATENFPYAAGVNTGAANGWALAANTTAVNDTWNVGGTSQIVVQLAIFAAAPAGGVKRRVIP